MGKRDIANRRTELQNILQRAAYNFYHAVLADYGIRNIHHIAEHVADFGCHELCRVICTRNAMIAKQICQQNDSCRYHVKAAQTKSEKRQCLRLNQKRNDGKCNQQSDCNDSDRNQRRPQIGPNSCFLLFLHLGKSPFICSYNARSSGSYSGEPLFGETP